MAVCTAFGQGTEVQPLPTLPAARGRVREVWEYRWDIPKNLRLARSDQGEKLGHKIQNYKSKYSCTRGPSPTGAPQMWLRRGFSYLRSVRYKTTRLITSTYATNYEL